MKGLIELSNFADELVSSKCTTPSQTEGEGEVKVKMYEKIFSNVIFSMISPYDVNLMYSNVVELEEADLIAEEHFYIH